MRFFVYGDIDYYPDAEFVEAESAKAAADWYRDRWLYDENWAIVVCPADQVQTFHGEGAEWRVEQLSELLRVDAKLNEGKG